MCQVDAIRILAKPLPHDPRDATPKSVRLDLPYIDANISAFSDEERQMLAQISQVGWEDHELWDEPSGASDELEDKVSRHLAAAVQHQHRHRRGSRGGRRARGQRQRARQCEQSRPTAQQIEAAMRDVLQEWQDQTQPARASARPIMDEPDPLADLRHVLAEDPWERPRSEWLELDMPEAASEAQLHREPAPPEPLQPQPVQPEAAEHEPSQPEPEQSVPGLSESEADQSVRELSEALGELGLSSRYSEGGTACEAYEPLDLRYSEGGTACDVYEPFSASPGMCSPGGPVPDIDSLCESISARVKARHDPPEPVSVGGRVHARHAAMCVMDEDDDEMICMF